jgi:hypothetical protein
MKRVTLFGVISVALAVLVACSGNKDTSPTAPTPAPGVTVSSVTISNTFVTVSMFQLNAAARMSDGSTRDVTSSARWETSNAALATISSNGLLTVVGSGEVEARATYQSVMGTLKILVTRPTAATTFTLAGVVREVAPAAKLVSNVRVVITAGADTGAFVVTDANGQFRFSSLSAGVIAMEATRDGYELWRVANLDMDQDRVLDMTLYPKPPTNAAGARATARCNDGTWSWATTRAEACSANGGVAYGVCPGPLCDGRLQPSVVIH